jgi:ABC-2 type transport system ATP-binding protein
VNAIAVTDLTKEYAGGRSGAMTRALDRVTFRVAEGEFVGLLGPNGSGKSTLLRLILGLLTPTAGRSRLWETEPGNTAARGAVGYLPEAPGFPPDLTGFEVIRLLASLSGLPAAGLAGRVQRILGRVGLAEAMHRRTGGYSQGMRQRLGLAQALVHDPRLLLLDEPETGLDPAGAAELGALLADFRARGGTVLLSSHVLGQVAALCDRIVFLHRGRVVLEGTMAELARRGDRAHLQVEALPAAMVDALRQWLEARGARLRVAEEPGAVLARAFAEAVQAGGAAGGVES